MKFVTSLAIPLFTIILTGCNTTSSEVIADNIDDYKFNGMNCGEIRNELSHLQKKTDESAVIVDKRGEVQDRKEVLSFLFFWPALFFIDSNEPEVKKYAQIKGEYEAAKRIYGRKACKIQTFTPEQSSETKTKV